MQEYRVLLKSEKFLNWKPERRSEFPDHEPIRPEQINPALSAAEKHFTPAELAELWGVSAETVRITFREEPGVLRLQQPTKGKRQYVLLRIPESVAERVHRRLSAVPL